MIRRVGNGKMEHIRESGNDEGTWIQWNGTRERERWRDMKMVKENRWRKMRIMRHRIGEMKREMEDGNDKETEKQWERSHGEELKWWNWTQEEEKNC